MKPKEIIELIDFIALSGLNEVNIETNEFKINIKKNPEQQIITTQNPVSAPISLPHTNVNVPAATQVVETKKNNDTHSNEPTPSNLIEIKSPMIGTFYRAANPESPSFVNVGDEIKKGQPVCIIEAMKLFNEIESEISGKIVKVLVDNATPVEYDQPLFLVEPV